MIIAPVHRNALPIIAPNSDPNRMLPHRVLSNPHPPEQPKILK
jgi:hypothetical protein